MMKIVDLRVFFFYCNIGLHINFSVLCGMLINLHFSSSNSESFLFFSGLLYAPGDLLLLTISPGPLLFHISTFCQTLFILSLFLSLRLSGRNSFLLFLETLFPSNFHLQTQPFISFQLKLLSVPSVPATAQIYLAKNR